MGVQLKFDVFKVFPHVDINNWMIRYLRATFDDMDAAKNYVRRHPENKYIIDTRMEEVDG